MTDPSSFHLAVPPEETQAAFLLSGFPQIRKPVGLCAPKPSVGQHLRSTVFLQEGRVLRELFSALFLLSMPFSTRDHPYHFNFRMGNIKSLDASADSSIYWSSSRWGGPSCQSCSLLFPKRGSGHRVSKTVLLRHVLVEADSLMSKAQEHVL